MIININELTNFKSTHGYDAEVAVQLSVSSLYELSPGRVTTGYVSAFDFIINDLLFELKISSKGMKDAKIELERADGRKSGLSSTKSDFYMFLNNAGKIGKIRLIKTQDLKNYYSVPRPGTYTTQTDGDKIGSKLAKLDFLLFNDLMIAEMDYNYKTKEFDTNTIRSNSYAKRFINSFLKG